MTTQRETTSELEALFVDEGVQAIDSVLRTVLEQFVGFTRDGRIITKPPYLKLSDPTRVLVSLLGRQAMARLKISGVRQEANPEELASECLVPVKSCREYLSRLKARRLLDKNEAGYFVPTWAVSNVATVVLKKQ